MRASQFFISTLKEAPAEAEVVSHQLMLRAGLIKRVTSGVYNYMPLGLRIIRKVEAILREEMNRAGALELLMPIIQPAELWQETGRWDKMGPELMRVKDRHERNYIVQPTSEEVVTDIARSEIKSYRQLPLNFYHIQTKFRDERRPRFGLMRGREFTMKDAYSFHATQEDLEREYQNMYQTYTRIFTRLGLQFRAVTADTGAIGGSGSHEFHVLAETGEDTLVYCPQSNYGANLEQAEAFALVTARAAPTQALQKTPTPNASKCEAVAALLGLALTQTVKSIVLAVDNATLSGEKSTQIWLLLLRGDHDLNLVKAAKVADAESALAGFRFATEAEIVEHFGCQPGYLGPLHTAKPVRLVVDRTVANMHDFVCGANTEGFHFTGVNWGRDLPEPTLIADIRNVTSGESSPDGAGPIAFCRGIEVGHVFQLGTRYSAAMKAEFLDETGKPKPLIMGCYGIGVTRLLGAAIEQNHDERGMRWPTAMAPFTVVICPIGYDRSELVKTTADALYAALQAAGADVLLDDRGERPGAMFADMELIGIPHRITVGERGLKEGEVEYAQRSQFQVEPLKIALVEIVQYVLAKIKTELCDSPERNLIG